MCHLIMLVHCINLLFLKNKLDYFSQYSETNQNLYYLIDKLFCRFESKICSKSLVCIGCAEPLSLGKTISVCSECSINVHVSCTKHMPNTCGLPQVLAKHYTDSLKRNKEEDSPKIPLNLDDIINVEGWIKVPT